MKRDDWAVIGIILLMVLVVGGAGVGRWYAASVQSEVYRREGIEVSTFEIIMGAKPAERTINLK